MTIEVRPLRDLTEAQRQRWAALVDGQPTLRDPFLHPQFASIADRLFGDVEVAVLFPREDGEGYLPFVRRGRHAAPVAEGLNEQQALIVPEGARIEPERLLRACRVASFRLDHFLPPQAQMLNAWTPVSGGSPQADLSRGFDAYAAARRSAGSSTIRETLRKERKLNREKGPVEFIWHDPSDAAFDCLLKWKRQQHQRTGVVDLFAQDKVVSFLREIRHADTPGFRARFSTLRVAGRTVAVHLGLFTPHVGHLWYPAYDAELGSYSTGLILTLKLMRRMAAHGVRTFDFGPGPQRYKQSLATHERPICIALLDRRTTVRAWRAGVHAAKTWAKSTPLRAVAPGTLAVRWRKWLAPSPVTAKESS